MSNQNFRAKNGLDVGIGGTILSTNSIGNIGIGTTNPTSKLTVVGDTLITGIATVTSDFTVNGGTLTVNSTNNRVGVGTTNPRFKLEVGAVGASGTSLYVNGDARITGILSVGQGTITLDGNTDTLTVPNLIVTSTSTGVANLGAVLAATYNMLMP